ncbi:Beta-mannosyltransferase 8 [Dissostichus eleginoides]|uniref:Beta-mannosyltransferase 8 n=1 Tax=Dissostichus eleginoides TaxID=100907 RepID=A0AAD9F7X7_DISEL|nr:Beta-mannosyltransferase 8 [Dissostichus eleginoides]
MLALAQRWLRCRPAALKVELLAAIRQDESWTPIPSKEDTTNMDRPSVSLCPSLSLCFMPIPYIVYMAALKGGLRSDGVTPAADDQALSTGLIDGGGRP